MELRQLLASNVRALRLKARMTQEELAGRAGFEQYYVSGLEAGRRNPTLQTLGLLASALGVRPAALFKEPAKRRSRQKNDRTGRI
jgi:transcriptional regulator with XRE-family HTH domain